MSERASAREETGIRGQGRDLEEKVRMIRWGVLAGGVDAVARALASGRARDVLGLGGGGGRGGRRSNGGRLGRAPRGRCEPIGAGRAAAVAGAARAVFAAPRHVAQRFLHGAYGPLLPGAPICSSSSRPLLVVSLRLGVVVLAPVPVPVPAHVAVVVVVLLLLLLLRTTPRSLNLFADSRAPTRFVSLVRSYVKVCACVRASSSCVSPSARSLFSLLTPHRAALLRVPGVLSSSRLQRLGVRRRADEVRGQAIE